MNWLRWIGRALRGLFVGILLLLCAAMFYLLVIMGDIPGGDPVPVAATATPQPLAALPSTTIRFTSDDFYQTAYYFNAPILMLTSGQGWQFVEGTITDSVPEGAGVTVREVSLLYRDQSGAEVRVSTMTPSRVVQSLSQRGYLPASDQSWTLAGRPAVLMSNGDVLHLHAQNGEIVYQIEGRVAADVLRRAASVAGV